MSQKQRIFSVHEMRKYFAQLTSEIKSISREYSCDEEYLEAFNEGKILNAWTDLNKTQNKKGFKDPQSN